MKLFKKLKKGFTLVELIVVIAVIAILAATSVGVYFGVTESAKKSNDQTVTNQMNKALVLDATVNGAPKLPSEALEVLEENGFDVTKMTPFQDGAYYLWDSVENKMILINKEGTIDFPTDVTLRTTKHDYFAFVDDNKASSYAGYSLYLKNGYVVDGGEKFSTSVDVGNNVGLNINYVSNGIAQTSIINTNGGILTVEDSQDTVNHYGYAKEVYVKAVSANTFNVYGEIDYLEVAESQHVVLKEGSEVVSVFADPTSNVEVNNGQVKEDIVSTNTAEKEAIKNGATNFAGGKGTQENPYLIASLEQIDNINNISTYTYYKWSGAAVVDATGWNTDVTLVGSFDGNGVTFNNLGRFLFRNVFNGKSLPSDDVANTYKISNITVNALNVGSGWNSGLIRTSGVHSLLLENINIHGYIEGGNVASFLTFGPGNVGGLGQYNGIIKFKNCHSDAALVNTNSSGIATGFICHAMFADATGKIILEDSTFTGTLTSAGAHHYVNGNWYNGTIEDNQKDQLDGVLYDSTTNGWDYKPADKKLTLDSKTGTLPANIGDVFTVEAHGSAVKATITLFVSPGPGNYTSAYLSETVDVIDGVITSSAVKYFTIRLNPAGVTESGANGSYFDVVKPNCNVIDSSTMVKITEYNANNAVTRITNIYFNDAQ